MSATAELTILGARGSIPTPGADFARYGGHTTAFALAVGGDLVGIVDAGTGIIRLQDHGFAVPAVVKILFTHYHWDHIQGLSMFRSLWKGGHEFCLYGADDPQKALAGAIRPPWFPVSLENAACATSYRTLDDTVQLGPITTTVFPVNHPQGGLGYRFESPTGTVAVVTDHESTPESDDTIARAIDGVDILIHDAQYLPGELEAHRGWGHSTWEQAVAMSERVGAGRLILTSHDPIRTDEAVDSLVAKAARRFASTTAAHEGLRIDF